MKNCKSCGKEIKYPHKQLLGDFCGENCFWAYEDKGNGKEVQLPVPAVKDSQDDVYFAIIKKVIARSKMFIISNQTLKPYTSSKAFDEFMVSNRLMIVRHDSDLSVIKKSIV